MVWLWIEIVEHSTEKVFHRIGPLTRYLAAKVDDGLQHNLDHKRFYTRVVADEQK